MWSTPIRKALNMSNNQIFHNFIQNAPKNTDKLANLKQYFIENIEMGNLDDKLCEIDVFREKLNVANNITTEALKRYKSDQLCICFDGGKDGHIVLNILKTILAQNPTHSNILLLNIIENPFPECPKLVQDIFAQNENIFKLVEIKNKNMVDALIEFKATYPLVEGIFMGMRRTDSNFSKNLNYFSNTNPPYPNFTIINPILDWSYISVWYYLLKYKINYCKLYDQGYTSLGKKDKTFKNQILLIKNETENKNESGFISSDECSNMYLPAFCMLSALDERSNRGT